MNCRLRVYGGFYSVIPVNSFTLNGKLHSFSKSVKKYLIIIDFIDGEIYTSPENGKQFYLSEINLGVTFKIDGLNYLGFDLDGESLVGKYVVNITSGN